MAAQAKRRPADDTATLLADALASLEEINRHQSELDATRLDIDPATAVEIEIKIAASRRDAQSRIELLQQRAAGELSEKQKKAQLALIGRIEKELAERDEHIGKMCALLADVVSEMRLAISANSAAAAAWPWQGTRDNEPCLFGLFLRSAIRAELYRLSGNPFSAHDAFEFPGAENPTPFTNLDPKAVQPLTDKAAGASAYASRIMREAPVRVLPPIEPPPAPKPMEVKPAPAAAVTEAAPQPSAPPEPEYVFHVKFVNLTGKERTEEVKLSPVEIEESFLDGIGPTGARGREIALRVASARVPPEYIVKVDGVKFDMARLAQSLER
jgi:hypothetical protein